MESVKRFIKYLAMAVNRPAKKVSIFFEIPMSIWAIGFVSLLINSSSVIIFSLYPLYATEVMGVTLIGIGFIEGIVEAISWFTRLFSGVISDYLHRRKPLLLAALGLSLVSRLIFPLAASVSWLVGARALDRIANGLQASPREALVGDSAPPHLKGTSYGLRQTLSLIGSCASSLLLLYVFRELGGIDYALAFWLALIPSALAIVILYIFVKDRIEIKPSRVAKLKPFHLSEVLTLPKQYWLVILVASFFMMSNYSGVFMIFQTRDAGLAEHDIMLVMVIQNLAAFLAALPFGWLSDKLGRLWFLALGFSMVILANLFLASSDSLPFVLTGVALWGIQLGINQSLIMAKIADVTPFSLRGTAFGIYYILVALTLFIANTVSGWLSHHHGNESVFYASSAVAFSALLLLPLLRNKDPVKI
jgi:MFS family permease